MKNLLILALWVAGAAHAQQVTLTPELVSRALGGRESGPFAQSKRMGCAELQSQLPRLTRRYRIALSPNGDFDCPNRSTSLIEALLMVEEMDRRVPGELAISQAIQQHARSIEITGQANPIGALGFNTDGRFIEVFDGGVAQGPEFMAAALAHEIRHADGPRHEVCVAGPLAGVPACDSALPAWSNWKDGGSYVYELAFQRLAIQQRLPGYQRYVRQFIGNLHIRFNQRPSMELLDAWIGPELLETEREFVDQVRARYY